MQTENKTPVILVGPGNLGKAVAEKILESDKYVLNRVFGQRDEVVELSKSNVTLFVNRLTKKRLSESYDARHVIVDCSKGAIRKHTEMYCEAGIPFVMLSTGEGVDDVKKMVGFSEEAVNTCVQDVNMSTGIMTLYGSIITEAQRNRNGFKGYHYLIIESHQASKTDVSGTALKLAKALKELGAKPSEEYDIENSWYSTAEFDVMNAIVSVRNKGEQLGVLGVDNKFLDGHAIHKVKLFGPTGEELQFGSSIMGRDTYAYGTVNFALPFLEMKVNRDEFGYYNMSDVLDEL